MTKLRAPWQVAAVAAKTHEAFHRVHPEFGATARWMELAISTLIRSANHARSLDQLYDLPQAPKRELLDIQWVGDKFGPSTMSIEVQVGGWECPTVTWRDLCMKEDGFGRYCLHAVHQTKGYRPLTKNLLLENCFTSETLVLTSNGWKQITHVTTEDLLWDGTAWVQHRGLLHKGRREVGDLLGVRCTPEHRIWAMDEWVPAAEMGPEKAALALTAARDWQRYS